MPEPPDPGIARALLAWYDVHARDLPWRVGPGARGRGERPDPYRVWLSEVMLQQTTVATVRPRFARFLARWPTVEALAAAPEAEVMAEWAGLGYYARARNLIRAAREVAARGGFPQSEGELARLPGVGPYTAAAVAAIAFDAPATPVDGNVERVVARLAALETPLPAARPQIGALARALTPAGRPGDFAQAVMDLGATVCTPRAPACGGCPLAPFCKARANGLAEVLPRRAEKPARPVRFGISYVARRADGALLLEERPKRGLLGGMQGWPGTDWAEAAPGPAPPLAARWRDPGGEVCHTFTHFHLRLGLRVADVALDAVPGRGAFVAARDFRAESLPSVMRKVWALASRALDDA